MVRLVLSVLFLICASAATVQAQPAPALTNVSVYCVASTGHPTWDYIPSGGISTPSPAHGGPELIVVTYDVGYSAAQQAKFNGAPMTLLRTDPVPATGPAYGFLRYWYISTPFTGGQFTYSSTSIRTFKKFTTLVNVR